MRLWHGLIALLLAASATAWCVWRSRWAVVRARVWRPSAPGFVFPELDASTELGRYLEQKEDFGIALAGGGERGFALAHGAVRSLWQAGVLQRARYLSTTSGSILLSLPMYYQTQDTLDNFLGSTLPLEHLSPELLISEKMGSALRNLTYLPAFPPKPSSSSEAAGPRRLGAAKQAEVEEALGWLSKWRQCRRQHGLCSCALDMVLPDGSIHDIGDWMVGKLFFEPYGLAQRGAWHCHETELDQVRQKLGPNAVVYAARDMSQNLPFSLVQSDIVAPFSGRKKNSLVTFPLEHTPLYTGTAPGFVGENAAPYVALGDSLVSSYAWPGDALDVVQGLESEIRVRMKPDLLNLGLLVKAAAAATSFFADWQAEPMAQNWSDCRVTAVERILPKVPLWSPLHTDEKGVPISQDAPIADPGLTDDLGHIPLLRRGVKKIIIYNSAAVYDNSTGHLAVNPCEMTYMLAAFGAPGCLDPPAPAGASDWNQKENSMTVFELSGFQRLWDTVKAKLVARESAVVRDKYLVVDNPYLGIKGGWEVEVVWVVLLPSQSFRSAVHPDTRPFISDFFPNVRVYDFQSRMMLGAFSQFASWYTEREVLQEVRALLGDAPEKVTEAKVVM